jgi:hypothetical protein
MGGSARSSQVAEGSRERDVRAFCDAVVCPTSRHSMPEAWSAGIALLDPCATGITFSKDVAAECPAE